MLKSLQKAVNPIYPEVDRINGISGVAVASVRVGKSGACQSIAVLEAPSPAISQAIVEAIRAWQFKPWWPADYVMESTITLYFVHRGNEFVVLTPRGAGYIGPHGRETKPKDTLVADWR
jgi:TonB family protein